MGWPFVGVYLQQCVGPYHGAPRHISRGRQLVCDEQYQMLCD